MSYVIEIVTLYIDLKKISTCKFGLLSVQDPIHLSTPVTIPRDGVDKTDQPHVHEARLQEIGKRIPRRSHYLDDNVYVGDPRVRSLFASRVKKPVYSPIPKLVEPDFQTFMDVLEEEKDQ